MAGPTLRQPPKWWYTGTQVQEIWSRGPHLLTDGFHCRVTYIHLRPVPPSMAWDIVLAKYRSIKSGDGSEPKTRVNCTTRAILGWQALVEEYNWQIWGRPAAGIAMQEEQDGSTRRHEVCWCIDPSRRLWILDNLNPTFGPRRSSESYLYSWAHC